MRENSKKEKFLLIAGLFAGLLFSSCDNMMDEPIRDFFKEYTETAAIDNHEFVDAYETNLDGIKCYSSDAAKSITFNLRNPQNYNLVFKYNFDNSDASSYASTYPVSFVQSSSRDSVKLTFPQEFLNALDCGSKNISGNVSLYEPQSGRYFESYPVTVHANSVPPVVDGACFQLTQAQNGTYIVCFYLPNVNDTYWGNTHSSDTRKIYFNGELRYFTGGKIYINADKSVGGAGWIIQNEDSRFSYSDSIPTMVASENGYLFDTSKTAPNGYSTVYFNTGLAQSTNPVPMEIKIEDDEGLSSVAFISNQAEQIKPPYISNITQLNNGVEVAEDSGTYDVFISHDGLTTKDIPCGTVTINYQVYDLNGGALPVKTGSATGSAKITLPKGRYKITAKASKPYYITSSEYDSSVAGQAPSPNGIYIKPLAIFYVSQNGSNETGYGSIAAPYRSIQKAVDEFAAGVTSGDYTADTVCVIRVASDLTPAESDYPSGSDSLVSLDKNYSYKITGYGAKRTIDAQRTSANTGRVIAHVTGSGTGTLELNNLVIKGGITSEAGAAINSDVPVTIESCTITGNESSFNSSSDFKGGIIYAKDNVTIKSSVISENSVTVKNMNYGYGLVIYGNQYEITDSTVERNTIEVNATQNVYGALLCGNNSKNSKISGSVIKNNSLTTDSTYTNPVNGFIYVNANSFEISNSKISGNNASIKNGNCKVSGTVYSKTTTKITGTNTIYNNLYEYSNSSTVQNNVYLDNAVLFINGTIGGKIGITTKDPPTSQDPITFTIGYSAGSNSSETSVFVSDINKYGIDISGSEATLCITGASADIPSYNPVYKLALDKTYKKPGVAATVTLSAKDSEGNAVTPSSYALKLIQNGEEIVTSTSASITVPAWLPEGTYTIKAEAVIGGVKYDGEFKFYNVNAVAVASEAEFANYLGLPVVTLSENITFTNTSETVSLANGTDPSENRNIITKVDNSTKKIYGNGTTLVTNTSNNKKITVDDADNLFLYAINDSEVEINNIDFTATVNSLSAHNYNGIFARAESGTVITFNYCTLSGFWESSDGAGSAFVAESGGKLIFNNCTFSDFSTYKSSGCSAEVIKVYENSSCEIYDCSFTDIGYKTSCASNASLTNHGDMKIYRTTFDGTYGQEGGAIQNNNTLYAEDVTFKNGKQTSGWFRNCGAGMKLNKTSVRAEFVRCIFEGNSTGSGSTHTPLGGAGIAVLGNTVIFDSCRFTNNTASSSSYSYGGAIWIWNGENASDAVLDVTFKDNGSVISVENYISKYMSGNTVTGKTDHGANIYLYYDSNNRGTVKINGTQYTASQNWE